MRFAFLLVALSATRASSLQADNCSDIFGSSQLSKQFAQNIAHGIHSLTVEDLRFYFNPNTSEANNIPTVNMDLQSSQPILNNAPRVDVRSTFQSVGMKTLDLVLSHMDNKMWDGKNMDVLDRLIHSFHMQEMWHQTAGVYRQIVANPPKEEDLCPCLSDVERNGVFHLIREVALMIREPEIVYNSDKRLPNMREQKMMYDKPEEYFAKSLESGREQRMMYDKPAVEFSKSLETGREQRMMYDKPAVEFSKSLESGRDQRMMYDKPAVEFSKSLETGREQRMMYDKPAVEFSKSLESGRDQRMMYDKPAVEFSKSLESGRMGRKVADKRADSFLLGAQSTEVTVTDEVSWQKEKKRLDQPMMGEMLYDLALFLYCMLEI